MKMGRRPEGGGAFASYSTLNFDTSLTSISMFSLFLPLMLFTWFTAMLI
jgi:hypothetical protein